MPTLKINSTDLERVKATQGEAFETEVEGHRIRIINTADGLKCQGMANGAGERRYTSMVLPPITDANTFKPSTSNYAEALASLHFNKEGDTLFAFGTEYRSKTDGANLAEISDLEHAYENGDLRKIEFCITIEGDKPYLKEIRALVEHGDSFNTSPMTTARKILAVVNNHGLKIAGRIVSQGVKPVWKDSDKGWLRIEVISEGFTL